MKSISEVSVRIVKKILQALTKFRPNIYTVWDNMEKIEVNSVPTDFPKLQFFSGFYPHSAHRTIHNVT